MTGAWAEDTTVDPIVEPPHRDTQELGFREEAPASLWDVSDDGPWAAASFAWSSSTAGGVAGWRSAGCWLAWATAHSCCSVILVALADVDSAIAGLRSVQRGSAPARCLGQAPDKDFLGRLFVALQRIARFAFGKMGNNYSGAYGHVHSCYHSAAQSFEAADETEQKH